MSNSTRPFILILSPALLVFWSGRAQALDEHIRVKPGDAHVSVIVEKTAKGLLRITITRDPAKNPNKSRHGHLTLSSKEGVLAECEVESAAREGRTSFAFQVAQQCVPFSTFTLREIVLDKEGLLQLGGATILEIRLGDFLPEDDASRNASIRSAGEEKRLRLSGTVLAPDGKPAPKVQVLLNATSDEPKRGTILTPQQSTTTDAQGRFVLQGIPSGLTHASLSLLIAKWDGRDVLAEAIHPVTGRKRSTNGLRFTPLDRSFENLRFQMQWKASEADTSGPEWTAYHQICEELQRGTIEKKDAAPRFIQLARRHRQHRVGVLSLGMVCSIFGSMAPGVPEIDKARDELVSLVTGDFIDHPELSIVIANSAIRHSDNSVYLQLEKMLRTVLDRSPHRDVRAHACFHLADFLEARTWLKRFDADTRTRMLAEAQQLKERIAKDFADVPHIATKEPLAELAAAWSSYTAVGKTAPEIVGKDANGDEFRLSDYRGKVVMLSFSANWCAPCRKLYPAERRLVEKYKDAPFVLLGVNSDTNIETLKDSISSGEITWRNWWDGDRSGPISTTYNVQTWPTAYILDKKGVVRRVLHGELNPGDEQLVEALLKLEPK